jgi:asparagine synthase (glutamine-hydrolysing)
MREEILAMTARLAHRGPDGQGAFVRGGVALGHARLAIIDLSESGAQPMRTPDDRLAVTFNGEIYNHRELRAELEAEGFAFRSGSDTEVILHAWDRWGEDCVDHFQGMFAFALCDFRQERLFLARDHAGIKPLFYRRGPGFFAFGSELSALRAVHAPPPRGSLQNVDYFLRFQYVPAPRTIFSDVFQLRPAHCLRVDLDGREQEPRRWWRVRFAPEPPRRAAEVREEVRAALTRAVSRSLVADVPVGIFLSGGLDSSVVAMEAARLADLPPTAFSIGFGDRAKNELPWAEQAARTLGLELRSEIVEHASLDILPELLDHYGEPFGDASAIPSWYVARLARREGIKTVLSGDGGDELFGGYERFLAWARGGKWASARRSELWRDIRFGRMKTLRDWIDGFGFGPEAWTRFVCFAFWPQRARLWRPERRHLADTPSAPFLLSWVHARKSGKGRSMALPQSMDYENYLPGAVLAKVDRASMAHGLEVRPALLDRELTEAAARLPEICKHHRGRSGKLVLKEILRERFDSAFVDRPKQGFGIPRGKWLSPGARGWEMLGDLLLAGRSPLHDWFEPSEIERHIRMHERGLDNSQHAWLLLVLALWADRNPDISFTETPSSPPEGGGA